MAHKRNAVAAIAFSFVILLGGCRHPYPAQSPDANTVETIAIVTWNVRGYPEKSDSDRQWFTHELDQLHADVTCIQEIGNQKDVDIFQKNEPHSAWVAFHDSSNGQDNAIFADERITMEDLPDPCGFQHPAQEAYVAYGGFDAVIITVHLSWTNVQMREQEKLLLKEVVTNALKKDPDVIICGDFNTKEDGIRELADSLGMIVMVPSGQDGIGTTYAGNRYDHFLISPDLANEEAVSCRIVAFSGTDLEIAKRVSDHMPVQAVFRTNAASRDRN